MIRTILGDPGPVSRGEGEEKGEEIISERNVQRQHKTACNNVRIKHSKRERALTYPYTRQ